MDEAKFCFSGKNLEERVILTDIPDINPSIAATLSAVVFFSAKPAPAERIAMPMDPDTMNINQRIILISVVAVDRKKRVLYSYEQSS